MIAVDLAKCLLMPWLRAGEWTPMDNTERNKGFSAIVRKFPVGAISMVSPFNFPCAPLCRAWKWFGWWLATMRIYGLA